MKFKPARSYAALALCVVAASPSYAQQTPPPAEAELEPMPALSDLGVEWPEVEAAPQQQGAGPAGRDGPAGDIRYSVEIEGLSAVGLRERFRELSVLEQGEGEGSNLAQLNRRAREDSDLAQRLLRAEGYYSGQVDIDVQPAERADERARVRLRVEPGPRYSFSDIEVRTPPGAPRTPVLEALGLKPGAPVSAASVQAAEDRIRVYLPEQGYPFASVGEHKIVVDHATRTASYSLPVDPGPRARFGTVRFEGDRIFGPRHLARLARFRSGDRYDAREVDDLRRALIATGLFGGVTIRTERGASQADGEATVNIVVAAERAPLRTIAVQGGYSTGEGLRVEASWQHRNLIPPEGAVTFRGVAGTREQRLASEFRRSNLRARDRTLLLGAEIGHEEQDAFEANSFLLSGRIERETNLIWQKQWFWSVGAELVASDERDVDVNRNVTRRRTFFIAALPLSLNYDGTDDLLDPHSGFRLAARLSPEASLQSGAFGYLKGIVEGSGYLPLKGEDIVFAARARAGSIFGADRDRIAPTRRFYAGGGGSVRGFGYQDIGPKDQDGDPIGGRSLAELSAEMRFRVFDDFGIVPFIDAGQLYTSTLPRFSGFRFGAGIGLRYYTGFGPIRVDLARALDRQPGDPKVAVYVSIGQAF